MVAAPRPSEHDPVPVDPRNDEDEFEPVGVDAPTMTTEFAANTMPEGSGHAQDLGTGVPSRILTHVPAGGRTDGPGPRVRLSRGELVPGTRYRLERWLGEGSMGVVYEAVHIDIERRVALKVLNPEFGAIPEVARIFRDEARASARIGAPNIVDIVDFAELPDGRLLYAMEFLEGTNMLSLLSDGPLEAGRVIGLMRQACKALGAAHAVGIVHRDVKPENMMVVRHEGRADFVKVVDFGISSMLAGQHAQEQGVVGTPSYMAPEQVRQLEFDGRLDVYALGCSAYELLTGRPVFAGEDIMAIMRAQVLELPVAPSKLEGGSELAPALEAVVMRCLEKRPEDRFADMVDLEAALCEAQIADGLVTAWDDLALPDVEASRREAIVSGMPSPGLNIEHPWRKWLVPALVVAALLLGTMTAALIMQRRALVVEGAQQVVAQWVAKSRAAAAKSYYVYPPSENPNEPTAYDAVVELERLDEQAGARAAAAELRSEMSETLTRLGDDYWERPGGRAFAIDYYAMALVFDPTSVRASERSLYTPGQLAVLRDKAESREFSATELVAAEPLLVLASKDTRGRRRGLSKLRGSKGERRSSRVEADLEALLADALREESSSPTRAPDDDDAHVPSRPTEPELGSIAAPGTDAESAVGVDTAVESGSDQPEIDELEIEGETPPATGAEELTADPKPSGERRSTPAKKAKKAKKAKSKRRKQPLTAARDRAQAKAWAVRGRKARSSGDWARAAEHFHRALSFDPANVAALRGLGQVHFDKGDYSKAVRFRYRAIEVAPRQGQLRLALGDALFKVHRYADARLQYERALKLGVRGAQGRLDRLQARMGRGD